jgi:hypothetical protein
MGLLTKTILFPDVSKDDAEGMSKVINQGKPVSPLAEQIGKRLNQFKIAPVIVSNESYSVLFSQSLVIVIDDLSVSVISTCSLAAELGQSIFSFLGSPSKRLISLSVDDSMIASPSLVREAEIIDQFKSLADLLYQLATINDEENISETNIVQFHHFKYPLKKDLH